MDTEKLLSSVPTGLWIGGEERKGSCDGLESGFHGSCLAPAASRVTISGWLERFPTAHLFG